MEKFTDPNPTIQKRKNIPTKKLSTTKKSTTKNQARKRKPFISTSLDQTPSKKQKSTSTPSNLNIINENELHNLLMKNSLPNHPVVYFLHRTGGILDNKFKLGNCYFTKNIIQPLHSTIKSWTKEGRKNGSIIELIKVFLNEQKISSIEMYEAYDSTNKDLKQYIKLSKDEMYKNLTKNFQGTNSSNRVLNNITNAIANIRLLTMDVSSYLLNLFILNNN